MPSVSLRVPALLHRYMVIDENAGAEYAYTEKLAVLVAVRPRESVTVAVMVNDPLLLIVAVVIVDDCTEPR